MTTNGKVPFLDLVTPHVELEDELVAALRAALRTASFVGGPAVESFERDFAAFCTSQNCIGAANGTDALRFAVIAAGVRPGDTVVTVPNTFIATTEAISQAGARPDFVDVDERTYTMSPERLLSYFETLCEFDERKERVINKRTGQPVTAVIPVHLYGQMADMDAILEIASKYKLRVIEDACQAHGAEYFSSRDQRWHRAGSMGHAAAFSFYPGKNLGACGEGGAITTNDGEIARQCRLLREHGQSKKYHHDIEGYNGRLDAIQAAFLRIKLRHLDRWNEQRRASAQAYAELLSRTNIAAPRVAEWSRPVYHLYVVRVAERDRVIRSLDESGIGTGIHYPHPLHLSKPYEHLGYCSGEFPVAERATREVLSLPMFPGLTMEQQRRVADALEVATSVGTAR